MALSYFFLKDRCNILRTGCTLGLVAGVILIFQPQAFVNSTQLSSTQNQNYTMINPTSILSSAGNMKSKAVEEISKISEKSEARDGYIFSVGALVLSALSAVLTKKITKHFEKILISLYLGISIGSVGIMQLLIFNPKAPTLPESPYPWLIAILVACLGMTQQFCLIAALKLESATRVTLIRSLQIVVSFIIQIQVWNETPGLDQVAGVIFVMSAIAVVTLEDAIADEVQRCCGCKETHIES
jgi:drug/metabolite transporter (DMT)-like permease